MKPTKNLPSNSRTENDNEAPKSEHSRGEVTRQSLRAELGFSSLDDDDEDEKESSSHVDDNKKQGVTEVEIKRRR